LRWGDVDWDGARIVVRSPKTAHHEGKASRVIPLFPELRPYLQTVYDELLEDFDPKAERLSEQFVITRYRGQNANWRTQLQRIIANAGLKAWPKLFQNLRATRETELVAEFPSHVVCEWIGHSATVAAKHYLQVTDDHFAAAAGKPLQTDAERPGTDWHDKNELRAIVGKSDNSRELHACSVGDEGLEPPTFAV
jgi:integrase